MLRAHLPVKADRGLEGLAMLLMIEKPRATLAERLGCGLGAALRAVPTALDAAVMWPFRAAENRRVLGALAAMSDRDLRDIGLTRGDLRDVLAVPVGSDGSLFLAGRRLDRRRRA